MRGVPRGPAPGGGELPRGPSCPWCRAMKVVTTVVEAGAEVMGAGGGHPCGRALAQVDDAARVPLLRLGRENLLRLRPLHRLPGGWRLRRVRRGAPPLLPLPAASRTSRRAVDCAQGSSLSQPAHGGETVSGWGCMALAPPRTHPGGAISKTGACLPSRPGDRRGGTSRGSWARCGRGARMPCARAADAAILFAPVGAGHHRCASAGQGQRGGVWRRHPRRRCPVVPLCAALGGGG